MNPKTIPTLDFITPIENLTKSTITTEDGNTKRGGPLEHVRDIICPQVTKIIKESKINPNLSTEHQKAMKSIQTLVKERKLRVTKADKGSKTVVMETTKYEEKCTSMLANRNTYKKQAWPKMYTFRKELYQELKEATDIGKVSENEMFYLLPTVDKVNQSYFYGLPKIHKKCGKCVPKCVDCIPLRPVVSIYGSVNHKLSKYLAKVLSPLVGMTPYHLKDSSQLVNDLSQLSIDWNAVTLASFDVESLFTNVDVDKAITILAQKMDQNTKWMTKTRMSKERVLKLSQMCIKSNHFVFQKQNYSQTFGLAMGSPLSPLLANLFMEELEEKAQNQCQNSILFYRRYVDDCLVIAKTPEDLHSILAVFNRIDPNGRIRLTIEDEIDGKLPFLDCLLNRENGTLQLSVYRKPTNSGRVVHFQSAQPTSQKAGIIDSLARRCHQISSTQEVLLKEKLYLRNSFTACGFPEKFIEKHLDPIRAARKREKPKIMTVIPYIRGISEKIKGFLKQFGAHVFFKKHRTIGQIICKNSPLYTKEEQKNLVYEIPCNDCDSCYVGMTQRKVGVRMKEHKKAVKMKDKRSALTRHSLDNGHSLNIDNFSIRSYGDQSRDLLMAREALIIKSTRNTVNKIENAPHESFIRHLKKEK